jgi:hypothetical protein
MPWVEFEPTIPASVGARTVHALDRWATVTGNIMDYLHINILERFYMLEDYFSVI